MIHLSGWLIVLGSLGASLASEGIFGQDYTGDGTYYGQHGGAGHCSMQFTDSAQLPWTTGVSYFVALNRPQYNDSLPCGTCVALHGTGPGIGTLPVPQTVAYALVADECPECKTGDLDIATSGDGRWTIQWHAVPCDVGATSFQYSFQNSNPWFVKLGITNTRVPPASVELSVNGQYAAMQRTIDNYFVLSSGNPVAFPASVRVTSIMGDTVEDTIGAATAEPVQGTAQFPVREALSTAPNSSLAPALPPVASQPSLPTAEASQSVEAQASSPLVSPQEAFSPHASPQETPPSFSPVQMATPSQVPHASPPPSGACNRSVDVYQACGGGGDRCADTGQCYDAQWVGTCCPSGTACTRLSEWYRQCLPQSIPARAPLPLFPSGDRPSTVNASARVPWSAGLAGRSLGVTALLNTSCSLGLLNNQQCGGLGGVCSTVLRGCQDAPAEGVCCPSGNFCQRQNAYYYKCVINQTADASGPPGVILLDQNEACGGLALPDVHTTMLDGVAPVDGPWQNTRCRSGDDVCMRLDAHYYECRAFPFVTAAAADMAAHPSGPSIEGQQIGPLIDDVVARAAFT